MQLKMSMAVSLNTENTERQDTEWQTVREQWANDVLKHYLMKGYFANQSNAKPE